MTEAALRVPTPNEDYLSFLRSKTVSTVEFSVPVSAGEVNPILKPHQAAIVQWMVAGGRRACFAAFGLGKTVIQIEAVRLIRENVGGRALIVLPLGVRQEFIRDAHTLATGEHPNITDAQRTKLREWQKDRPDRIPKLKFIRLIEEASDPEGIYLTNYETVRDGKLSPQHFMVASLDEASVLRGFGGTKTFREFMALFAGDRKTMNDRTRSGGVPYRFVATATPSPNDYIELLAYAAYLGIMDVSQAKTRFFKRDSTKADVLTIHPHKEREFWLWIASWALFVQRPSDLGFSDDGYLLPDIEVRWHEVRTDHSGAGHERNGQNRLFRNAAIGVTDAAQEKRSSMATRIAKLMEVVTHGRRREANLPEGILPQESGSTSGGSTSAWPTELQGGATAICSTESEGEAKEVRPDARGLSRHFGRPRRRVRDLRDKLPDCEDVRGPLSPDRDGAGAPVRQLQSSPRVVWGKRGAPHGSSGLPDQIVIWCDLNAEQRRIESALSSEGISVSSLDGGLSVEEREGLMNSWRGRETTVFLSKPVMYGAGVNLQQSHTMIFAGIGFKAQDFIQAIHRIHRYQQTHPCTIHIIYTEAEREVRRTLERKWSQHKELVANMTEIIKEYGLSQASLMSTLGRALGVERVEVTGENYRLVNNDSVIETRQMEENSVGLILTSVPFSTQYEYSPNYADFGHTDNNDHFFRQMDFLTPELLRILQPGRIAAIHVKDRIVPGGMTGLGFQVVYPFHCRTIEHYTRHGFAYMGMKTIVTDVVRENNQTYRLGWTEQCKDGSKMGVGMPEYLLLFRKPPTDATNSYADTPVVKSKTRYTRSRWQIDAHGFARSSGDRLLRPEELEKLTHAQIFKLFREYGLTQVYDFEHHVKIGEDLEARGTLPVTFMLLQPPSWHPDVWTDITRMLTLNGAQSAKGKEMHLCPMQFDLADRVIEQFSMPGETVMDPFGGLMTVPYRAIRLRRRGLGIELCHRYFLDGAAYCKAAEQEMSMPGLFDVVNE